MLSVIIRHSGQRAAVEATIDSMRQAWAGPTEFIYAGIGGSVSRTLEASSVRRGRERDWQLAALQAATGDYLVFLNADDGLTYQGFEKALSALGAQPGCALAYGVVRPSELQVAARRAPQPSKVDRFAYLRLLAGDFLQHQCAIVYRRSQLQATASTEGMRSIAGVHLRLARQYDVLAVDELLAIRQSDSSTAQPMRLKALIAEKEWTGNSPTSEQLRLEGCDAEVRAHVIAALKRWRGRAPNSSSASGLQLAANAIDAVLRHPRGLRAVLAKDFVPWVWRRSPLLRRLASNADAPYRSELQATEHAAVALESVATAGSSILVLGPAESSARAGRLLWSYGAASAATHGSSSRASEGDWDYIVVPADEHWWLAARRPELLEAVAANRRRVWNDMRCSVFEKTAHTGGRRTLVTGYFSFGAGHATAGDLDAQRLVTDWLQAAGRRVDVATATPFVGGVDWRAINPQSYDCVIFVCGPFRREPELLELLERFRGAKRIGLNLTLLSEFVAGDAFDVMLERDSRNRSRPDMAFGAPVDKVPLVGVCLREHASGTQAANAAIAALLSTRQLATVSIDTRLDDLVHGGNASGLRSTAEIETLISRMDVVVTTRLHGLVLALKHGIPVVAIDPGNDGNKICHQAEAVGWPAAFALHEATETALADALTYGLSEAGRLEASKCAARGLNGVERLHEEFLKVLPALHGR